MRETTRYEARKGLGALFYIAIIATAMVLIYVFTKNWLFLISFSIPIYSLLGSLRSYYLITDDNKLVIKSNWNNSLTIDPFVIKSIKHQDRFLFSGLLQITYKESSLLYIAPKEELQFIETLKSINREIDLSGLRGQKAEFSN